MNLSNIGGILGSRFRPQEMDGVKGVQGHMGKICRSI